MGAKSCFLRYYYVRGPFINHYLSYLSTSICEYQEIIVAIRKLLSSETRTEKSFIFDVGHELLMILL